MTIRHRRASAARALAALGALVTATVLAVPGTAAAAPNSLVPIGVAGGEGVRAIPGSYVVQLKAGTNARTLAGALGVKPRYVYEAALNGFAGEFTPAQLRTLRQRGDVVAISQNVAIDNIIDAVQPNPPSWGIDRIDQRNLPLSASYTYNHVGTGVRVYVIDTGIDTSHPNLEGRALFMHNSIDANNTDCNSHGTHVAGTVGSETYGVAKNVYLRAVKALDCGGGSNLAALVGAVNWVTANSIHPAVANTSWNWPADATLEAALNGMINSGVFLATSAGNTGGNSCDRLPRKIAQAMVVANSTITDTRSSSSSIGPCVDIYAPGTSIRSTIPGGGNGLKSGTSMATPHVAGVVALYKQTFGDNTQANINNWLVACASVNKLTGDLMGTPNRLLYTCAL